MRKSKKMIFIIMSLILVSCLIAVGVCFGTDTSHQKATYDLQRNFFRDVNENDWFYDDVKYTFEKNIMNGTSEKTFSPDTATTRGMIVTILWRIEQMPVAANLNKFIDVEENMYYSKAVNWAEENKIVSGYSNDTFAPDENATREQLAAVIYRYAKYKEYDVSELSDLDIYSDNKYVSNYSVDAFRWAVANGIITGTPDNMLMPNELTKRSQLAAILHRFCNKFMKYEANAGGHTDNSMPESENDNSKGNNSSGNSERNNSDNVNTDSKITAISIEDVAAKPGDDVQVKASISNNPGILGMTLSVYFDDKTLKLQSVENGLAFNGILDFTSSKVLENGSKFLWDGIDLKKDDIRNGDILVMNFTVSDSASAGEYPIILKYFDNDIVDKDLKSISVKMNSGRIVIPNLY